MSDQPRRRPDSDSVPVPADGTISVGERIKSIERWTRDHDNKDDERHEGLMSQITSLKEDRAKAMGFAVAFGALASLMGIISAAASVYAAFVK